MEKAISIGNPNVKFRVRVTPEQLREIANRIEDSSRVALPGQEITYPLSGIIELHHDPEVSLARFMREALPEPALVQGDT